MFLESLDCRTALVEVRHKPDVIYGTLRLKTTSFQEGRCY